MRKIISILFPIIAASAWAQVSNPSIITVTSAPAGACTSGLPNQQVVTTGVQYSCQGGTWGPVGGGTGGAVSGQANGVIPLATAATTIGAQSHLSDNGSAISSSLPVAFQDGSTQVSAAYRTPGITVSPLCPTGSTTCVKINGDTQYVVDATSNSTTTLTCPDCAFTQADVGKVAWATTQGTGAGVGYLLYTTLVCPQTTIASVTNSTTVVLANACTASGSGNVVFIWGHDDGATLNALNYGCNVVHVATANTFIMTSQPAFLATPTGCNQQLQTSIGAPGPALVGDGFNASQVTFILTPNFTWGNCGTFCFGRAMRSIANIQFWGTGLTSAANSNCANGANKVILSTNGTSSEMSGVVVAGICPGTSGMIGIQLNNTDENLSYGGALEVGTVACNAVSAAQIHMQANDCLNTNVSGGFGLSVTSGAQVLSYGNSPIVAATVDATSQLSSWKSNYATGNGVPSLTTVSGSRVYSMDDTFQNITHGGTIISTASTWAAMSNSGLIISGGGNKFTGVQSTTSTGQWTGADILAGSCRGTLTAGSTLGFYGFGQFSSPTCNTTVNQGIVVKIVPISGSIYGMQVYAGTGGVNASDGVVTILDNGSTSYPAGSSGPITCTLGTGTFCNDSTHFLVPAVGDVISARIVTQAATTLANVTVTTQDW